MYFSSAASGYKKDPIFGNVLKAMILKRWWLATRDRRQFLLLVLLPIVFLFLPILLPDVEVMRIKRFAI